MTEAPRSIRAGSLPKRSHRTRILVAPVALRRAGPIGDPCIRSAHKSCRTKSKKRYRIAKTFCRPRSTGRACMSACNFGSSALPVLRAPPRGFREAVWLSSRSQGSRRGALNHRSALGTLRESARRTRRAPPACKRRGPARRYGVPCPVAPVRRRGRDPHREDRHGDDRARPCAARGLDRDHTDRGTHRHRGRVVPTFTLAFYGGRFGETWHAEECPVAARGRSRFAYALWRRSTRCSRGPTGSRESAVYIRDAAQAKTARDKKNPAPGARVRDANLKAVSSRQLI